MIEAWGKSHVGSQSFHHLAHHSADVAATFMSLFENPSILSRAEAALGRQVSEPEISCLGALAFLHDIGKLAPGFQAKAWPEGHGLRLRGHLECGWHWLKTGNAESLNGAVAHLSRWPGIDDWFPALFAHHGRPIPKPQPGGAALAFPVLGHYDWRIEEAKMGSAMLTWFPEIVTVTAPAPEPRFVHFICGLLTLADWIASDRRSFMSTAA